MPRWTCSMQELLQRNRVLRRPHSRIERLFSGAPCEKQLLSRALAEPCGTIKLFPAPDKCTPIRGVLHTATISVAPLKGFPALLSIPPAPWFSSRVRATQCFQEFRELDRAWLCRCRRFGSSQCMVQEEVSNKVPRGKGQAGNARKKTKTWGNFYLYLG